MVELLYEECNFAIVKLPQRKFPGVVVQGDTFSYMCALAEELKEYVDDPEGKGIADELLQMLKSRLDQYEEFLGKNGIQLPFVRPGDVS